MKFLPINDLKNWPSFKGAMFAEYSDLFLTKAHSKFKFTKLEMPLDSGKKTTLARSVVKKIFENQGVSVAFNNWNVWPSSGHVPLMIRLRQSLGTNSSLEDMPGQFFHATESDDAASVVLLCIIFFWDCLIFNEEYTACVIFSHDGWYAIGCEDEQKQVNISALLESVKLGQKIS
jgi:hypothetical protein